MNPWSCQTATMAWTSCAPLIFSSTFSEQLGKTSVGELVTWTVAATQCATSTEQKKKKREEVAQLSCTTVAFITSRFLIFDGLAVHVTYNGVNNSRLPSAAGAPLSPPPSSLLPLFLLRPSLLLLFLFLTETIGTTAATDAAIT